MTIDRGLMTTNDKVMRVTLPSDLSAEEIATAANSLSESPVEEFVVLPENESAGYLEMDLRPDKRYLYWTVPGSESTSDGKVTTSFVRSSRFHYADLIKTRLVGKSSTRIATRRHIFLLHLYRLSTSNKVHRKRLSNSSSDPTIYEDLSGSISSGMAAVGLNLMDPLGIALDLRDQKV